MKKNIKNSINKIEISNSQKEEIYQKIVNKKSFNFNVFYRYACLSLFVVLSLFVFNNEEVETNAVMLRSVSVVISGDSYQAAYIPYELGDKLDDYNSNGVTYEVYENKLNDDSLVLYNEFYEVYLKVEE